MSTLVTRTGKGSPLTHNEVDANFNNLNTDKIQSGNTVAALTITSATINGGAITGITDLAIADGGTGSSSAPQANATLMGWSTTATAAGTTTLTNTSTYQQNFTGSTTQTVVLPVTSTLALGWAFEIINNSTGTITVNSSGGNLIGTVIAGSTASVVCNLTSGTTAASWDFDIDGFATETGTGSVVRATSPTLVAPALGTPSSCVATNLTGTASGLSIGGTATTATTANATNTSNNFQMNSLGIGTAGSGTTGEIRATNNITAYYSSDRKFKENIKNIDNAIEKAVIIGGKYFDWTDEYIQNKGGADGYFVIKNDIGVIAQDVQSVLPEAVRTREDGTLAVDYQKLVSLAFAAISELKAEIELLKAK